MHKRIWIDFGYLEIMGLILLSLKHAKSAWDQNQVQECFFFWLATDLMNADKVYNIKQCHENMVSIHSRVWKQQTR